jgi:uncharacterized protein (TIRG00374 family)
MRVGRRLLVTWAVSLAVLAAVASILLRAGNAGRFAELITRADPWWLVVGVGLQALTFVCIGAMWGRALARADHPQPLRGLARLAVAKVVTDQVFPTGGIGGSVLVIRALEGRGVPRGPATAAIVVDLLSRFATYAVLLTLGLGQLAAMNALRPAVVALTGTFSVLMIAMPALLLWLNRQEPGAVPRFFRKVPGLTAAALAVAEAPSRIVRDRRLLAKAMSLRACVFFLQATSLGAMLAAIGQPAPVVTVLVAFLLASVAEMVAVLPGGLGTYEGAAVGILHLFGIPVATALAAVLLLRGISFWLPIPFGLWFARRALPRPG